MHAFALGKTAIEDPDFFRGLAERTGGKFVPVENPADVVSEFANIRFTGLKDVQIESSPIGQPGTRGARIPERLLRRLRPARRGQEPDHDHRRDGGRREARATRTVYYERPKSPSPADELAAEELRETLQDRKVEIELLAEMRRAGPPQMRKLTVEAVEPPDEDPPKTAP